MQGTRSPAEPSGATEARHRLWRSLAAALLAAGMGSLTLPATGLAVQAQRRPQPASSGAVRFAAASEGRDSPSLATVDSATPKVRVSMVPQLADNLALLFEKFADSEFIVCIEGTVDDESGFSLRDFRMPHIAYSRTTGTGVHPDGGCGQYSGIVGTLHSHPPTYPQDRGREADNCYLSRPDIVSWLEHSPYPYTMVMCGPRMWAWWHRSQVDVERVLAFPPPGQLQGRPQPNAVSR